MVNLGRIAFSSFVVTCFACAGRSESLLDVLVLYTDEVESYYSGPDGVRAHIQGSFSNANVAFETSEIAIQLRISGIEKIDHSESSDDMGVDLNFITESSAVANLRNQAGADLVCLFRNGSAGNVSGTAWLLDKVSGDPSRGFSVVSAQGAFWNLSLPHEIGHNLGGAHDRDNSENGGLYPYSHGHRYKGFESVEYRTIMAYAPGKMVNIFSNSEKHYFGGLTGVASGDEAADNARGFNEIASTVEAYRDHIHQMPIAFAGNDVFTEDANEIITLDGSLSEAEGEIVSWHWSWNGGSASGWKVEETFPMGKTVVTLKIVDDEGYSSEDEVEVTVLAPSFVHAVEAGANHSFFLKRSGIVYGAGGNAEGQLGGVGTNFSNNPTRVNLGNVVSLSGGAEHSLFVRNDSSAWAVGNNEFGQLGDGTTIERRIPVEIFSNEIAQVAAGTKHSLFLKTDGSLWTVGDSDFGLVATDGAEFRTSAVKAVDGGVTSIWAGPSHSLFIKSDGSLWGGGYNSNGQLGDGTRQTRVAPIEIMPSGVSAVSGGDFHTLILKNDGSLWVTGRNHYGQLGDGTKKDRNRPIMVIDSEVSAVSARGNHSLILKTDGSLWVMGQNWFDLDKSGWPNSLALEPTLLFASGVSSVSAGQEYCLIRRDDGSIWAGGRNRLGQLGVGNLEDPTLFGLIFDAESERQNSGPIADAGPDILDIDGDGDGTSNVTLDGSQSTDDWQLSSWNWSWPGGTAKGEIVTIPLSTGVNEVMLTVSDDDGLSHSDSIFVTVHPQTRVKSISAGDHHSLILKQDGSLWAAGDNANGRLGDGTDEERREFQMISSSGISAIAAGYKHSLFLKQNSSLWGMGSNEYGSLGSEVIASSYSPIELVESGVRSISARFNSFFIMEDGSLWGMGPNENGQLGDGSEEDRWAPTKVVNSGVTKVFTGRDHNMYIKSDGSLWAMGSNNFGQLGDGSTINRALPVEIFSSGVLEVALGRSYSLILKNDSSLWICGVLDGQAVEHTPVPFNLVPEPVESVASSDAHYFVLMKDGSLWGGGDNYNGLFGDGTKEDRTVPSEIMATGVKAVSTGNDHCLILMKDGALWGAGANSRGQLGLDSKTQSILHTEIIPKLSINGLLAWLNGYFTQNEIDAFGDAPDLADPDLDGLSNDEENRFGLNPSEPFDPFTQSETSFFVEDGSLMTMTGPFASGLQYIIWGSEDLINWKKLTYPSFERDEMLLFKLANDQSLFYRVEISD